MNRGAIDRALEALEAGDQALARELLLGVVDDAPAGVRRGPPVCPVCGVRAWPGDDAAHVYSAHHPLETRSRRAA